MLSAVRRYTWDIAMGSGTRKLFIGGFAAAVVGGSILLVIWRDTSAPEAVGPFMPGPQISFSEALEHPLDDGEPVFLSEARRRIPYEISLPAHARANSDNLRQVFVSPQRHVALRFSSDVLIILQRPDFHDPAAEFAGLIASGSVKNGRLDEVRGAVALVMEPDTDVLGTNPGSLQFVRNGVSFTLYAAEMSGFDLKEIAESIP